MDVGAPPTNVERGIRLGRQLHLLLLYHLFRRELTRKANLRVGVVELLLHVVRLDCVASVHEYRLRWRKALQDLIELDLAILYVSRVVLNDNFLML